MMHLFSLLLLQLIIGLCAAQNNVFTTPPDVSEQPTNNSYTEGTLLTVAWEADLENIALTIWWLDSGDTFDYLCKFDQQLLLLRDTRCSDCVSPASSGNNITNRGTQDWIVGDISTGGKLPNMYNTTFYFLIYDPGSTTYALKSSSFNITRNSAASVSTTLTSTSTTVTSSTLSTSATPVGVTANPTSSNSATTTPVTENKGLSSSAKTGLGVGIGLGIPLLIVLGVFIGWKLRSTGKGHKKVESSTAGNYAPVGAPDRTASGYYGPADAQKDLDSRPGYSTAHELEETRVVPEMPVDTYHEMPSNPTR